MSKWTKVGPCCDFAIGGCLLFNLLPTLFSAAFQKFKPKDDHQDMEHLDPGEVEEQCWHKVNGVRLRRALKSVRTHSCASSVQINDGGRQVTINI